LTPMEAWLLVKFISGKWFDWGLSRAWVVCCGCTDVGSNLQTSFHAFSQGSNVDLKTFLPSSCLKPFADFQ
jgi:hypothetical protein